MSTKDHGMGELPEALSERFQVITLLDDSGVGPLYEVIDSAQGHKVALRVLRPEYVTSHAMWERYKREISALSRVEHPAILKLFEARRAGDCAYFVTELVDGRRLDRFVGSKPLSVSRSVQFLAILAAALEHMHQAGIVHRDVQPSRIMVTRAGLPKLLEFGLVKLLDHERFRTITETGEVLGTLAYVPPEVLGGEPHGPVGDVYQLAATFYEVLTRQSLPSTGAIMYSPEQRAFELVVVPPSGHNDCVDDELDAIVMRALEPDPCRRFASALQLFEACKRWLTRNASRMDGGLHVSALITGAQPVVTLQQDEQPKLPTVGYAGSRRLLVASLIFASMAVLWFSLRPLLFPEPAELHRRGLEARSARRYAEAAAAFDEASRRGHGPSQYQLGRLYLDGLGVRQDELRAVALFEKAAKAAHPPAFVELGRAHLEGKGAERSVDFALRCFAEAARLGKSEALEQCNQLYEARVEEFEGEEELAAWYGRGAELGIPAARTKFGQVLLEGKGVQADPLRAVKTLEAAVEQGYAPAMTALGECFERGRGRERNLERAVELYRRAVRKKDPQAMFRLACILEAGKGSRHKENEARQLLERAAAQSHVAARCKLALLELRSEAGPRERKRALANLRAEAERGHVVAQLALGRYLSEGAEGARQERRARKWLRRAAKQGHLEALFLMGRHYEKHAKGERDLKRARAWYRRAMEAGHEEALAAVERVRVRKRSRAKRGDEQ